MANTKKLIQAAAGNVGDAGLNVEQVFSTYLYDGNEGVQTIINDINLGQSFSGTGSDGSALFGGNGDYVTVSGLSSSITGDFTIELFAYNTSPASEEHVLLGPWGDGTHGNQILVRFTGERLGVNFPSKEVNVEKSIHGIGRNEWFHLAITRSSGTFRIFTNGIEVHESTSYTTTIDLGTLYIGSERSPFTLSGNWEGNISNVRVSDTTAFYTSNFTLPTANLTNISNTDLLTLQGSTPFVDNSSNSLTVTDGGSVSAASGGPFPVVDGEGGMVWVKARTNSNYDHYISNTERGVLKYVKPNATDQEGSSSNGISAFTGKGFTIGGGGQLNNGEDEYASWTWRKAEKFFDCVTYVGNSTAGRTVSHNLGSTPGMIIVKSLTTSGSWPVYHRGITDTPETKYMNLNSSAGFNSGSSRWDDTAPTDTEFTVGDDTSVNANTHVYVAFLFAHNDGDAEFGPNADADIIKCDSYTGNGGDQEIDLGFEPQWILFKSQSTHEWAIMDTMRGLFAYDGSDTNNAILDPTQQNAESVGFDGVSVTSTGFKLHGASNVANNNGTDYIYTAIRRGPMAVPEDADNVFEVNYNGSSQTDPGFNSGSVGVVDLAMKWYDVANYGDSYTARWFTRLTGTNQLTTTDTTKEGNQNDHVWDFMNGVASSGAADFYYYLWKRAPNFCDVVTYEGNSTAGNTISHNLGVAPEMMWVKKRSAIGDWYVYHSGMDTTAPEDYRMSINSTAARVDDFRPWNDTAPTDTVFSLGNSGDTNDSGVRYIAYLFASLDGVSKVGSYAGTGSDQNIECGFSSGARFVMIKRSNSTGDWVVFDSVRGITASSSDPFIHLNQVVAEDTNSNKDLDTYSSGFKVSGADTDINASGSSYIFYAIA